MAQMLRGTCARIVDAAQRGRHHVAVFERGGEAVALVGIVAQPVQQFREAPLGGVDAAAPVDGVQLSAARAAAVISRGFFPGAMIAPEVIIVERLQAFVHGNDAGAGGVERDGFDRARHRSPAAASASRMASARARHVVRVALRGVVGIFLLAMQRILADARAQAASGAVEDGDPDAQSAEIDTGDDTHSDLRKPT